MKNKILTIVFISFIGFFSLGYLICKDRDFSDMENRYLQKFPEFSMEKLLDGTFTEEFEAYATDQIILKDEMVKVNNDFLRLSNRTYINGVYFLKNNRLIQEYDQNTDQLDKNIKYINRFVEENNQVECSFILVPNASLIYGEQLPYMAPVESQDITQKYVEDNIEDKVAYVDPTKSLLNHKEEYIFFNTDHHWTMLGAYYGYRELADKINISCIDIDQYEKEDISNNFYGSLYSKAPYSFQSPDTISIYSNPNGEYHVEFCDDESVSDSLFIYENAEIKDKYTMFLGGNHSLIKIKSNSENHEKILVIKDSYAHCMVPFLADNYDEIYMMDLRYYHQSVNEFVEENNIKKIIFIYNVDFFNSDNNFVWLDK